jgi:hypothetical protein
VVESYGFRMRDELLAIEPFDTLLKARRVRSTVRTNDQPLG